MVRNSNRSRDSQELDVCANNDSAVEATRQSL